MRNSSRYVVALTAAMMSLAVGCSSGGDSSTTAAAVTSTSVAPAVTTTVAPAITSPPTTAAPAGPAVAEAGGWRMAITAPTNGASVGPNIDFCWTVTGPAQAAIAFDVAVVLPATGTVSSFLRVDGSTGSGSARVGIGTLEPRFYDMTVQGIVNGQPVDRLAVRFSVRFAGVAPTGCP